MSMTLEEATNWFETYLMDYYDPMEVPDDLPCEVAQTALSALRPVSREQVEKVWRSEWVGVPNIGVYDIACSKCGYCSGIRFWDSAFCPNCGAPMTDEAMQMVMERMDALHDTEN